MYEQILRSGKPDEKRRACVDCRHLKGAVSLWCQNEARLADGHSAMPRNVPACSYWVPCRTIRDLSLWERLFKRGLVLVDPL